MKKIKLIFYLLFAGLGLLISLGACLIMYLQFRGHIRDSYMDTLGRVALMVEKQYPVLSDIEMLKQGYEEDEDWFWDMSRELSIIADTFGVAYIYYIERTENGYVFRMSSYVSRDYHPEWIGGPVWTEFPVPAPIEEAYDTQQLTFVPLPTIDEWGILVSALLPIVRDGETIGLLGVDYDISYVDAMQRPVFIMLIISIMSSLAIVALIAFIGSRSVLIPIHEREQAAREAEERRKEFEALAEALKTTSASKSAFMANISHEMRTPLNAIIGLSSLMLGEKELSDDLKEHIAIVNDSGHMLLKVINDILEINKIEAGKLEIIPAQYELPDLISDISALYAMGIEDKPILFEMDIDEKLPLYLFGDELRIKQICYKLLSNALKFTSSGTITLSVSCERPSAAKDLSSPPAWDDKAVILSISVKDTGIGIQAEEMDRIFSDYGQVDNSASRQAGGTGLGLSVARRLADLMDGTISATSEIGKGSTFTLSLRQKLLSNREIGSELTEQLKNFKYINEKRGQSQQLVPVKLPHARVLIVDDVLINLKVARGLMARYGMQIDCVSSGKEAVELVRRAEVNYNIIFMDYMMPEMDGVEATKIIRKEIDTMYAKTVPIVALTAVEFDGKERFFLNNGFNAYLGKPIDPLALDREINRWVRGVELVS